MTWNWEWPVLEGTGTSAVSGSTEQIRANWEAMETVLDTEHESMASANAGNHIPGQSGFMYYGAKSDVLALSSPGTGALAYASDTGEFLIHIPTGDWEGIATTYWSRARKVGGSQSLPNDIYTKITISETASGTYDSLSEVSANRFTAKAWGYYLVIGVVRFPVTTSDYHKAVSIYKNGVGVANCIRYGRSERTLIATDILNLSATNYIELYGSQNSGVAIDVSSAVLVVQRVS